MKYSFAHTCLLVTLSGFGLALTLLNPVEKSPEVISQSTRQLAATSDAKPARPDSATVVIFNSSMNFEKLASIKNWLKEETDADLDYLKIVYNDEGTLLQEITIELKLPNWVTNTRVEDLNLKDGDAVGFAFYHHSGQIRTGNMKDVFERDNKTHYSMDLSEGKDPLRIYFDPEDIKGKEWKVDSTLFVVFDSNTTFEDLETIKKKTLEWGVGVDYHEWEMSSQNELKELHYLVTTPMGNAMLNHIEEFDENKKFGFAYNTHDGSLLAGDLSHPDLGEEIRSAYTSGLLEKMISKSKEGYFVDK